MKRYFFFMILAVLFSCQALAQTASFKVTLTPSTFTVEDSIYLHQSATGRGLGRALLTSLIARCEQAGSRQMIAVIGDSANTPSVRLHAALGFRHAGVLQSVGYKFGQWHDTVLMQRGLES